ncbi:MAG TPA: molybdopterin-guanine dinucleotide biosynthesis protein B [Gemmatimonadaceae bacterium]|nr:molybdopterin-guanine dinucleotide biosynthesis protein B [Gemmatimonadaceae bacterium]
MPRPPMVAIVGKKHSGKTTLVVRLAAELGRRGARVMTIKHGSHTFNIDPATTDTYRHYHEGAVEKVAMVAPDKFALVERWDSELAPETIAERYMGDADVVICEGFKASALPKIEVFRPEAHTEPLYAAASAQARYYLAIITDAEKMDVDVPVMYFSNPGWLSELAMLVESRIMGRS